MTEAYSWLMDCPDELLDGAYEKSLSLSQKINLKGFVSSIEQILNRYNK